MILKSLKLRNIRSYIDESVEFPEGTTLLSGDIGSGKTTILIAVEFALFGLMRGSISGTTLLRHGCSEGEVELKFEVEGKEVIVKRTLKKGSNGVQQSSGFIVEQGSKFEGTAVELKAKILSIIGYPEELVSKSKSLVFRYTVYTPQEEMKAILFEGRDARLDTLRRIFDVDKYKRIRENAVLYVRELKQKRSNLEGKTEGIDELSEELKSRTDEMKELKRKLEKLSEEHENVSEKLGLQKEKVLALEKEIKEFEEARKNIELNKRLISDSKEAVKENAGELEVLGKNIESLEEELSKLEGPDAEKLAVEKKSLKEEISGYEKKLEEIKSKYYEMQTKKKQSSELKTKVSMMEKCPVCRQRVDESHKEHIEKAENEKLEKISSNLEKLSLAKEQCEKAVSERVEGLEKLRKQEAMLEGLGFKKKTLEEKKERREKLSAKNEELREKVEKAAKEIQELEEKAKDDSASKKFEDEKKKLEELQAEDKELGAEKAGAESNLKNASEQVSRLEEDLGRKKKFKEQLRKVSEMIHWLNEYFVNVVNLIEKQVLLKIYSEFNEYFVEWFNVLIEDEDLTVRLDEEFSPLVEQNGYEAELGNLSGGEKTSVALAYRLALNKVINDFIGTIKTKDLIILDEPTDGFSSEQLDKVREVLHQLDIRQTIIVSHEQKMESYVDNVLRVYKREHVSKVEQ